MQTRVYSTPNHSSPLTAEDAVALINLVKDRFEDQPDQYERFLDVMKDFKSKECSVRDVIRRICCLFNNHPDLIEKVVVFLPPGYQFEYRPASSENEPGYLTLKTPEGETSTTRTSTNGDALLGWMKVHSAIPEDPISSYPEPEPKASTIDEDTAARGVNIRSAVQYVEDGKQSCDETTYNDFLNIMAAMRGPDSARAQPNEIWKQISMLFRESLSSDMVFRFLCRRGGRASLDPNQIVNRSRMAYHLEHGGYFAA